MKISVITAGVFNKCFQYEHDCDLSEGTVVEVPFGSSNRSILGIVSSEKIETDRDLKSISKVLPYNIGENYVKFLNWMSSYTLIPRGMILKMILAEKTIFSAKREIKISQDTGDFVAQNISLNEEQQKAFDEMKDNRPFLLQGVTGSGKTEVYLKKAKEILDKGKQILILFPEIALTNQIQKRIEKYLGVSPIIWNSTISTKNRKSAWLTAFLGQKCVVIGARSALFLPFKNLGLIVVDEEHDSSYKQQEQGCYNARDMAVVLAKISNIPLILASATPSIESIVNVRSGKYGYFNIQNRYGVSQLPTLRLIDMRQNKFDGFISPPLYFAIKERLEKREQCLIYLNRRGYSPITLCKGCGEKLSCPNCSIWLVYHKDIDKLICHYCGHKISIPKKCVHCEAEDSYIPFGPGVERICDEIKRKIPNSRVLIASSDTFSSDKDMEESLAKIHNNEVDIIIGTQILAKGHHFPNITLVGIIDGDLGLFGADLRASEHTYQLINQVAGRAGREEKPGEILIQTFKSDHPLFQALLSNNSENFINLEIENRKNRQLPPFTKYASIIISGKNKQKTENVARLLRRTCPKNIKIFGPAPAPIFMIRGRVRWRILLKSNRKSTLNTEISAWLSQVKIPPDVKITLDIDPITFL
jgi:primosomal protein N' (replication factor Y)